jgi:hypothetical protein
VALKNKTKSELDLLIEIDDKLNTLIAVIAIQGKERDEQIKILASSGLSNSYISSLLGIPKGTVDFIRAKKKKKA